MDGDLVLSSSTSNTVVSGNLQTDGTLTLGTANQNPIALIVPVGNTTQLNGTNVVNFGWNANNAQALRITSNVNHITFDNVNNQTVFNAPVIVNANTILGNTSASIATNSGSLSFLNQATPGSAHIYTVGSSNLIFSSSTSNTVVSRQSFGFGSVER